MMTRIMRPDVQPRSTQRKIASAISAIAAVAVFVALAASAAAQQAIFTTTQQQPGFPQMPPQGARPQPPNAADLPPGTATLRGHVFAADNGQPLRKAQVRLMQQLDSQAGQMVMMMPRESRLATTDAQGAYEFKEVRAGRYTLSANKGSFVPLSYGQTRPTEPGKPLQVIDNQTIERIDFSLPHGGIITGRILDEFGEPLSDVMVAPQRYQYLQGQRRLVGAGRSGFTNDLGEFRIFGVAPGQYYLQATWRSVNPMGFGGTEDKTSYAPMYFPGTIEIAQAQRLTISVGSEISDVVMTMKPIKAASVSGTAVDSHGAPMVGMLMVGQQDGASGFFATGSGIKPDGTFQLNGLAPGEYVITAQQMGGNPQEAETATLKITVAGEDITGVHLAAAKPISTRGRVIVDPGAATSLPPRLMLQVSSPQQQMMPMIGARMPAAVQEDMSFELKTAPGVYRLNLMGSGQGWTIRSVRRAATDVTDSGFEVKNGDDTVLEVELTNKLTTITGLVTNARGAAVKDYTAIVFAQDPERWKGSTRYQSTGRPDQDGRFNITGLPPGEYYIIALDRVDMGETSDPEFLEKMHTRASRITLDEGETKTVDLRLNTVS
jgi:protocatechuate 3,4-dioxygenase beta subunit